MKPSAILNIALDSPLRHGFDYLPPDGCHSEKLIPGLRIKVPLRGKTVTGVLLATHPHSSINPAKLKRAEAILDTAPLLSPALLQLATWASNYYQHPIGEVVLNCLPTLLRQGRIPKATSIAPPIDNPPTTSPELNAAQQAAIAKIKAAKNFHTFLLDGITGSGKTEVYLQIIAEILATQQQALILVPEIGLTPQTVARFQQRFNVPMAVLHSNLSDKERMQAWLSAQTGQAAIVIGTRSAIFTPMPKLGIIILDEEHDLSFKQQSGFRYSARDIAIIRGQIENIPILLGTATPSLESFYNAEHKRFHYLSLPQRAGAAISPSFQVIDIRNQYLEEGLSTTLLTAMRQHLAQNNQVLLFLNRRGFAPTLLCHTCGWLANCHRCDARLTIHQNPKRLFCHHCDTQQVVPQTCAQCNSTALLALGLGTERLEKALERLFPEVNIVRIDRDTTRRKGSMQQMLDNIQQGHSRILIGTQMLTKGHHFPDVTLVGIVDADSSLFSADFRASERMGQLMIQVAGRAGRAEKPGTVLIQTHHPEHPLLLQLLQQNYQTFAKSLLQERQATRLPPYGYLALIRAESPNASSPLAFLDTMLKEAKTFNVPSINLLGPQPAPMERKAGRYRAQLLIHAQQRKILQNFLKLLISRIDQLKTSRKVRWSLDVDPLEMF